MERVRVGMKIDTKVSKVAKMQIRKERTHDRRAVARKKQRTREKVAREKTEHVGLVVKQYTLQRGVEREATTICTPLMKMTVKTLKKHLTMMKGCKRGFCWKKLDVCSGKRRSADETKKR